MMNESERKEREQRFTEIREMLKKIPGVVDVGVGFKETGGKLTDEVVLAVFVERKKQPQDLLPEHVIAPEIYGIKTDVVEIKVAENLVRPIRGGVKMDSQACTGYGTLGCMATHPDHGTVLLTNHHVLYDQFFDNSSGVERDVLVGQPGIACSWCCKCNVIGAVKNSARRNNGNVDCGIAKINSDINHIDEIDGGIRILGIAPQRADPVSGTMRPALVGDAVSKTGARTGRTLGRVTRVGVPVTIRENDKTTLTQFVDQLWIESADGNNFKFSDHGDSGSVILNSDNEVVGLLFGGLTEHTPYATWANDIYNVVAPAVMNITINVTRGTGVGGAASFARSAAAVTQGAPDDDDATYQMHLTKYKQVLERTEVGRELLESVRIHAEEVRELVYHNRHVTVPWQRHQGPAFVAAMARNLKQHDETMVKEVNGISLHALLEATAAALIANGSEELRSDVRKYSELLLPILDECRTNDELIARITEIHYAVQA